ncbi:CTLH LisH motif-containing protein [Artemisia annua]|uniref:CTLH LisH motif-containing protein n=2 Tax=Artemisia annua TaxID=35608 RepID=A0A2U1LUW6_ARTAN|nr:CTLH LisH motif-containing protein [Artemisia annua]
MDSSSSSSSSSPVNWEALDSLVIEFAKSENLIEDDTSSPTSSPSSSSYQYRLLILQIRRLLQSGCIDDVIHLLRHHAPSVLDDHRLLFRLQKQKFIELLRKGSEEDRNAAIDCLRTALAPSALDAYPEAYEEFKHVLLAFIYDKDDQTSPVVNEWSERRLFELAGLMTSVLRAHLHAYDPLFSMAIRYLISIHKGFCLRQRISSPITDLTERLLLEERDLPATPQEGLFEVPPFDEVDIQALAHAVELTRQGAVDSLKFAKGDLFQAFQNEVCRMRLDFTTLDELVHEYCVYRGIVNSGAPNSSFQGMEVVHEPSESNQTEPESTVSTDFSLDGSSKLVDTDMDSPDAEERYPCGSTMSSHEDCSTSGVYRHKASKLLQRNHVRGTGERNKRKRWRGRDDSSPQDLKATKLVNVSMSEEQQVSEVSSVVDAIGNKEDTYEIMLAVKELASKGMAAEVVEGINDMDPTFFEQNHILLFQLKRIEFLKLVNCGDHSRALKVACSHLGPLATRDPALLKPLKETLFALLTPNEKFAGESLPFHALSTSLQVAIGRRLGIEEPQLMKIMRTTLHTHNEWFKLQMCKDRFEGLLKIDLLKEVNSSLLADNLSKSSGDISNPTSSQGTATSNSRMPEDGNSPAQVSSTVDVASDETAILKVMEFLALPRADAIHLLAQYNGDAETVIQQIFA